MTVLLETVNGNDNVQLLMIILKSSLTVDKEIRKLSLLCSM